ncbi:MAG: hypothetical protein PHN69_04060 [Candidatus Pacebacteria bacterium]|nr:hypothetical protein [Fermentimonas sp.]MDD4804327.1 hypothetical protein [Candidatus Paceibacterota bacterium]
MTLETFLGDLSDYLEVNDLPTVSISGNYEQYGNGIYMSPYGGLYPMSVVTNDANPLGLDLQILVSNSSNETALAQTFRIIRLLRDVHNEVIGNTKFLYIQQKYGAFFIGKSNSGNYNYTINFSVLMA